MKCKCGNEAELGIYNDATDEAYCEGCVANGELPDNTELIVIASGEVLKLGWLRDRLELPAARTPDAKLILEAFEDYYDEEAEYGTPEDALGDIRAKLEELGDLDSCKHVYDADGCGYAIAADGHRVELP